MEFLSQRLWRELSSEASIKVDSLTLELSLAGRHKIIYDDNETEYLLLSAETIRWDKRPAEQNAKTHPDATLPAPEPAAGAENPANGAAEQPLADQPPQPAAGSSQAEAAPAEAAVESKEAEAARLEVGFLETTSPFLETNLDASCLGVRAWSSTFMWRLKLYCLETLPALLVALHLF